MAWIGIEGPGGDGQQLRRHQARHVDARLETAARDGFHYHGAHGVEV